MGYLSKGGGKFASIAFQVQSPIFSLREWSWLDVQVGLAGSIRDVHVIGHAS